MENLYSPCPRQLASFEVIIQRAGRRSTDLSDELMDDHNGLSIIYRQHGVPCPLVRWHFHKEYELHLIVASITGAWRCNG